MITSNHDHTDRLFHALADQTRRDILRRSLASEHSITSLANDYDMSFAAVQKHVAVLQRAGLITKRRIGREALASGNIQAVRSAEKLLHELVQLWHGRIARIDSLLDEENSNPTTVSPDSISLKE